ncbi:MAG: hypothetical protein Q9219_001771 [cf. Caloplaca sp. 3 TL-2023]
MSAKLDMALDDVVMTERTARRRGRGRGRRVPNATRKVTAPVGGVQKNTKPVKVPTTNVVLQNGLSSVTKAAAKESKIIVSNLPSDVTEKNVKPDAKLSEVEFVDMLVSQSLKLRFGPVWQTGQMSIMQTMVRAMREKTGISRFFHANNVVN